MGTLVKAEKPHAVCIPYPAQGHINPMLKLAKLLHYKGFHITFVNTEFNHKRILKSRGPNSLDGLQSFRFKTIPDGLPLADVDATQDIPSLSASTSKNCLQPFRRLLEMMNEEEGVPPVSCVVSDGLMSFTLDAAEEIGVPEVLFWTTSACVLMCGLHFRHLIDKGFTPLKDSSYLTNGYLDTPLDWIPGLKNIRLRDYPTFVRTTNPEDILLNFVVSEMDRVQRASAIILNTFDALEHEVIESMSKITPPLYPIGPLQFLENQVQDSEFESIGSNLWKEERECLKWLDAQNPKSVVYVNFGSVTVMTSDQLIEFAFGLANSNQNFLWVIRPDLVSGKNAILPAVFLTETKNKGVLSSWCPQEKVLGHPSVGGFLTHSGWNSTLESVCGGVAMVCWPFFADQQTNCRYCCTEWGIGMEIDSDVKRDNVERLVRELMEGEKGKEMKEKALGWKELALKATAGPGGSSYVNLENVINKVLLSTRK